MTTPETAALHAACEELFASYPLAAEPVNDHPVSDLAVMILMTREGATPAFFFLERDRCGGGPVAYSLCSWPAGHPVNIGQASVSDDPDGWLPAIGSGWPLPRSGSLLAWAPGGTVTALMPFYAERQDEMDEQSWAIMPRAGGSSRDWPPFTGQRLLGPWFWEHYRAGRIADLRGLITSNPSTTWWSQATVETLGSGCCAVTRDVHRDGLLLPEGRYAYYQVLRDGLDVPSLDDLLGGALDLSDSFSDDGGYPPMSSAGSTSSSGPA